MATAKHNRAPVAPTTTPPAAPAERYTLAQLKAILAEVASRASTQRQILIAHADTDDAWAQHLVEAAILIITDIGAMADEALGGAVCGTGNDWRFGPLFERDGGAA